MKVVDDLPAHNKGRRGVDWAEVCAFTEKQKGKWVEVGLFDPSVVSHIRNGKYPSVDPERFEVTSQGAEAPESGGRRSTIYIRLIV